MVQPQQQDVAGEIRQQTRGEVAGRRVGETDAPVKERRGAIRENDRGE